MTQLPPDQPPGDESDHLRRRRRRLARAVGLLVAVVVVVAFVIENAQSVKVRFWFVTAHPRLIWVIVACLVAGVLFGMVLARQGRRRRAALRGQRRDRH